MFNFFRPKAGRFGTQPVYLKTGQIGGTNYLGGANPITASGTTIFRLGGTAGRRAMVGRLGATAVTVPISASGTLLAALYRYNAATNTAVKVSGDIDLEALVTREEAFAEALALSAGTLTLQPGDALEVHVVSTDAIGTQPAGLVFTAEALILE
jgi:hypothetical protein